MEQGYGTWSGIPTLNEPGVYQKQISFKIFTLNVKLNTFQNQIWDSSQKTLECKIERIKPSKQNLVTRNPANVLLLSKQRNRMKLETLSNSHLGRDPPCPSTADLGRDKNGSERI